jgi:hypothetical protein
MSKPSSKKSKPRIGYFSARHYNPAVRPIPVPLWGANLRFMLGRYRWGKLRAAIMDHRGLKCESCGKRMRKRRRVYAHEHWSYLFWKHKGVAILEGIGLSCWHCHAVEHFGVTRTLVAQGILGPRAIKETIAKFCQVNRATRADFERHLRKSMAEWNRLSDKKWKVDWGKFGTLIDDAYYRSRVIIPKELLD